MSAHDGKNFLMLTIFFEGVLGATRPFEQLKDVAICQNLEKRHRFSCCAKRETIFRYGSNPIKYFFFINKDQMAIE